MKPADITSKQAATAPAARRGKARSAPARHSPAPRDRGFLRLAHQHILSRIASGELPSGTALSELSLAAQLGLSRTPVREAIGQLVAEGILEKTSRGAVVTQPTRQDIVELYELREALETYAVARLAERGLVARDREAIDAATGEILVIRAQLEKSGKPVLDGELLQRFVSADIRFHMHLLEAAGNRRFVKVIGHTRLLIRIFTFRRAHHTADLLTQVHAFHRKILHAVVKKNADLAARLMREHIRLSLDERLAEYRSEWAGAAGDELAGY